jgi:hypothetical protein
VRVLSLESMADRIAAGLARSGEIRFERESGPPELPAVGPEARKDATPVLIEVVARDKQAPEWQPHDQSTTAVGGVVNEPRPGGRRLGRHGRRRRA